MAAPWPDARRPALLAAVLLCAALGLVAGLVIGPRLRTPSDDSPEAGFARDMATHHAQAVDMSFLLRDRSMDADLRTLADDIIVTQSTQRGMFMGWLQEWGLRQASAGPRMAWMPGHEHLTRPTGGAVLMHGMATDAELQQLRGADGIAAEILFLQLMIRHHEGGVLMARAIRARSDRADVVQMARSIEDTQGAEIAQMKAMLTARGARPLPSLLE
jgi:uncharacterized protein (DUF305 family)